MVRLVGDFRMTQKLKSDDNSGLQGAIPEGATRLTLKHSTHRNLEAPINRKVYLTKWYKESQISHVKF